MPDLANDTTAAEITEDVRAVLALATVSTPAAGTPLFAAVKVYDDVESFERTADPMEGMVAGIITGPEDREPSEDNGSSYVARLQVDVAFRFRLEREAGGDEKHAMAEAQRVAALIRTALVADKNRGGRTAAIAFRGKLLDATDVSGPARLLPKRANQAFYTAVVPVACGIDK